MAGITSDCENGELTHRAIIGLSQADFRCTHLFKPTVPRYERFQHVRDQYRRIDCLAIRLRMQRSIAIKVSFQADWTRESEFDVLGLRQRPEPQLVRTHCDAPSLKNSG